MSYNYSYDLCSNFENQDNIYAFGIKIINFDDETIKKNLISLDKTGELLEYKNNIKKIKVTFCLLNSSQTETIVLKRNFIEEISDTVVLFKKNIIIYLHYRNDNININYQII